MSHYVCRHCGDYACGSTCAEGYKYNTSKYITLPKDSPRLVDPRKYAIIPKEEYERLKRLDR